MQLKKIGTVLILILCLAFSSICYAQEKNDKLPPSLNANAATSMEMGYPADLRSSKLFYIKMKNKKNRDRINQKILNKRIIGNMKSSYRGSFKSFENNYLDKGKQYFLDQGYKYRLIMYYALHWSPTGRNSSGAATNEEKQKFQVVIEDLETGTRHVEGKFHWRSHVMKKFFKAIR